MWEALSEGWQTQLGWVEGEGGFACRVRGTGTLQLEEPVGLHCFRREHRPARTTQRVPSISTNYGISTHFLKSTYNFILAFSSCPLLVILSSINGAGGGLCHCRNTLPHLTDLFGHLTSLDIFLPILNTLSFTFFSCQTFLNFLSFFHFSLWIFSNIFLVSSDRRLPPDKCCVHTKTYLWQSSSGKCPTCFTCE